MGLDQTSQSHTWGRQEEVLQKVLKFPTTDQIVMLHLRGGRDDPYGSDVHGHALRIVRAVQPPTQVEHLHGFTGKAADVAAWLADFP